VRTETDIHFLKILSIRAASVLTQARLLADRAALLEQSQALHRVSSSLVSAGHLPSLMQKVSDVVCEALRVDRVLLILLDIAAQSVQEVYQSPLEKALPVYGYDHYMSGLTGWAVVHQQTVFSSKHGADSRESEEVRSLRMAHEVGSIVVAPLLYEGRCLGTLTVIRSPAQDDFDHRETEMIESIANQAATAIEFKRLYDTSKHLADTDSLTGLNNRRRFFELGNQEFQRAQRTSRPLSAIMIDVDHFKRINDSYGHATGDEVLKTVASRLEQAIRKIDILGRYGGEEFALLLPEATITMASEIAERISESIKLEMTTTTGVSLAVTATLGVASLGSDTIDLYRVLDKADRALYQGKNAGRNCIYVL
jgi:diguanylate cyclase (GGDEF)-like protein